MKIHTGDSVLVISGKDKGKQGSVIRVLAEKNRIVVEGINMRVRHIKKTPQQAGQRITYEASLAVSNVMLLDPKTKKPTRVGYRIDPKTGKKERFAKVSGEALPLQAKTKAAAPKKEKKKAGDKTEKSDTPSSAASLPAKQPFWKRAFSGAAKGESEAGSGPENTVATPVTPVRRARESS